MSVAAAKAAQGFLPTGNAGNWVKVALVIVVLVIIIVIFKKGMSIFSGMFDGVNSLLETLGIKDSAEDKKANEDAAEADEKATATVSPFNPTFYKNAPGGTPLLLSAKAKKLSDQVYDSVGSFYDDPESGYSAVKQCTNWAQVSQLSDMFQQQHQKDLYGWLKLKYDTTPQKDMLAKIVKYATNLPKY